MHELDVANAAVAGLHVARIAAFEMRALLDAAFQRLDAGDVGAAQVAAIDPGLAAVPRKSRPGPGRRRPGGP